MDKVTLKDLQYCVEEMYDDIDELALYDASTKFPNPYTNEDYEEFRDNQISDNIYDIYRLLFELYLQKFEEYGGKYNYD